jgi:class 3 adenylate cyclase
MDERLDALIRELEPTGGAIEVLDSEWRLVWVSDELKQMLGEPDEGALGYGEHILSRYQAPPWRRLVDDADVARIFSRNVRYIVEGTPGGLDALREFAGDELTAALERVEPEPAPPMWAFDMTLVQDGAPAGRVWCYSVRLHDRDGRPFAIVRLYTAGLPAHVLALVTRGDETLLERMAQVTEPRRRAAGVLFADLDASGALARRLAGETYFRVIDGVSSAIDAAIIERGGIVGKHAGDGATGFFLAEQLGSDSAAARAALEAACQLPAIVARAVRALAEEDLPISEADCKLNIGVHWGASLYIGRLQTQGRVEVTALGDEVNECARIEQSAHGGQVLAAKAAVERLSAEDAAALGLEVSKLTFRTVAELPDVGDKAKRDAGGIAVVDLRAVLAKDA